VFGIGKKKESEKGAVRVVLIRRNYAVDTEAIGIEDKRSLKVEGRFYTVPQNKRVLVPILDKKTGKYDMGFVANERCNHVLSQDEDWFNPQVDLNPASQMDLAQIIQNNAFAKIALLRDQLAKQSFWIVLALGLFIGLMVAVAALYFTGNLHLGAIPSGEQISQGISSFGQAADSGVSSASPQMDAWAASASQHTGLSPNMTIPKVLR
jgi:hypothetical protein